jgi:hypothetical protein
MNIFICTVTYIEWILVKWIEILLGSSGLVFRDDNNHAANTEDEQNAQLENRLPHLCQ